MTNSQGPSAVEELRRRARRRWLLTAVGIGVAGGIGGGLGSALLEIHSQPHPRYPGGRAGTAAVVTVSLLLLVVAVVMAAMLIVKVYRGSGMLAPPLIAGLPRRSRRIAWHAMKAGVPSADPTLRAVEEATALRIISQARMSFVVFGVALVGELAEGIFGTDSTVGKVFFLAAAVMFAVFAITEARHLRAARRYLAAQGEAPPDER